VRPEERKDWREEVHGRGVDRISLREDGLDVQSATGDVTVVGRPRAASRLLRSVRDGGSRLWPALIGLVVLIGLWQLIVSLIHANPTVLPTPARVAAQGWDSRAQLWSNAVPTIEETVIGMACALAVSAILATAIDLSTVARRVIYPLLVASQSIPVIVIAPLFVIWFGFGLLPKILVIVLVTFFPTTVSLLEGFNSTEAEASRLIRSMGGGHLQEFWKLRVPTALPFFFTGLRVAVSFAVLAAIFGEWVGAINGLGIYMELEKNALRTDLVFAAVVLTACISMVLYGFTFVVQRLVMPWYIKSRRVERGRG
jgi:ABC-type nitrate/sulfonate/bicarbonate transport system permease component